jgi:GTPase
MLEPEVEFGNKEYKRYIKEYDKSNKHFYSLTTQLNWRLNEGNGICYYYIGVEDNGEIYCINNYQYHTTFYMLESLCRECDASLKTINTKLVDDKYYYIITIIKNNIKKEYNENRILFIGNTGTFKTSFIAKILKGTDNKNYIVNHKHEIESGKTSSINYYVITKDNNKYLIFDSPGDNKYHNTLMKIVKSIDFNSVLFFSGSEWKLYEYFYNYFNSRNIPIINVDNNILNMNKKNFINLIENNKKLIKYNYDNVHFNILQTFYINEIGFLVSGYLKSGIIKLEDKLIYSHNDINIVIKSIHKSKDDKNMDISTQEIKAGQVATLLIESNELSFNKKIKYGYIYNL